MNELVVIVETLFYVGTSARNNINRVRAGSVKPQNIVFTKCHSLLKYKY